MDNRILFGIMTIIFNAIGVPCFMVGNTKDGILRIVFGIISCGVIEIINIITGIIQGIKILQMTDEDFAAADKADLIVGIPTSKPKAE